MCYEFDFTSDILYVEQLALLYSMSFLAPHIQFRMITLLSADVLFDKALDNLVSYCFVVYNEENSHLMVTATAASNSNHYLEYFPQSLYKTCRNRDLFLLNFFLGLSVGFKCHA